MFYKFQLNNYGKFCFEAQKYIVYKQCIHKINSTNGLTMTKYPLKTYIFGLISLTQIGFIKNYANKN